MIGPGHPTYVIAEMSANHGQDLMKAREIVHAAKAAGADAIKLQTYTPDTMTLNCPQSHFQIGPGSIWEGRQLYELYGEAHTPWDWHAELFQLAQEIELDCFSSPFDRTAVDFLETLDPPCYKVASCLGRLTSIYGRTYSLNLSRDSSLECERNRGRLHCKTRSICEPTIGWDFSRER